MDLGDGSSGTADFIIQRFRNDSLILSPMGTNIPNGFTTFTSPNTSMGLDHLDIQITADQTSSYNIDNIAVNTVPEPATVVLLSLGFAALAASTAAAMTG